MQSARSDAATRETCSARDTNLVHRPRGDCEKMDVENCAGQDEAFEGKLVVFSDVEYRLSPGWQVRLEARCGGRRQRGAGVETGAGAGRLLLRGLCGALRPARLTFILGPSGAGKSTLLQILAGRRREGVSGTVIGGRGIVLVAQHATLLPALTAREVLAFAAALKLPRADRRERQAAVERLARQLGIEESLDTRTPKMSGGERKRLSIACELLTDPPVLLLDEPTSGLDSVSSLSVVRALADVARGGRTVACVVHQPASRIYNAADDLVLLAGGRTLYAGPRRDVPAALLRAGLVCPAYYNPADYLLELATGEHGGDLNTLEREARVYSYGFHAQAHTPTSGELLPLNGKVTENGIADCNNFVRGDEDIKKKKTCKQIEPAWTEAAAGRGRRSYAAGGAAQVRALLWRCGVCGARDVHVSQLRLAAHVLVALLLGALYAGAGHDAGRVVTNASCLFFFTLFLFFSNAMPTIHTFPAEAEVVIQEHLNYWYSLPAYCLSKILADLPVQILCATAFTVPAWLLTGQPQECWRLLLMWLVCVLLTILAQTSGLAVGAACDVKTGLFIVPASNIPMLMFSGFFIRYDEMPVYLQPLAKISYFRYAYDAALQSVYGFGRESLPCHRDFCMYRSPDKFLEMMSLPENYRGDIVALLAWIVVLQAALMAILFLRVRRACK